MAKSAQIGEIRTWSNGRKYQKTANGWVPVKSGFKGNAEQKEESAKGKSSKGDLKLKDGWNEHLSLDSIPSEYKKAAEALAKKFPDIEFSVFAKNGEAYIADATLKSSRGYLEMEFDPDGGMTIDRRDNNKEPQDTIDANVYHLDDRQVQEALEYIGYYDDDEDGEVEEDTFKMIDPSEVNDVSELYDKVPGLSDNAIDAQFDENYEYYKEEMGSSEEDDIFSEALADTVRWVNKQGLKASKEQENEGSGNESGKDSESNPSNEDQSYSPEQLADFAKSASDEGLKRAASSGDEQMRIAAKREIARRKNEGMENDTDNPFDKGSIRKSQREERIYKGQVYEKIDGGWIKKK